MGEELSDTVNLVAGAHGCEPRKDSNKNRLVRVNVIEVDDDEVEDQISNVKCRRRQPNRQASLLRSALPESNAVDNQMFAMFFDDYLPQAKPVWRQLTYLRTLAETVPASNLLKQAKRMVGLAHLATRSGNQTIAQESRISYGRLLGMLNFSLHFPRKTPNRTDFREMLSSISLVTHMSDKFISSAQQDDSWVTHLQAAQYLLTSRGLWYLEAQNPQDKAIVRHTCFNSFFLCIAKRKAWMIDSAWFDIRSKGWPELLQVFHGLPTLLEETDHALSISGYSPALLEYVSRLYSVTKMSRNLFTAIQNPSTVSAASIDVSSLVSEENLTIKSSNVFPELFAPLAEMDTIRFVYTTVLSLITECTILRIWHLKPDTLLLVPEEARRSIQQNSDRLARRLCMASLSMTQTDRITSVYMLRMCLLLARNVFEQQQATAEVQWCDACLTANQRRLQRIQTSDVLTLCKVSQVIPGIVEAGRYKSDFNPDAFVIQSKDDTNSTLFST